MIWSKIGPKMPKMAKTMPHYSSFGLTKRPKKFETISGTLSFFSVVSHGITHIGPHSIKVGDKLTKCRNLQS